MTIWRMPRIACWIPTATNTHSQYVILTAFALQQWFQQSASMLRYTYAACLVYSFAKFAGRSSQKSTVYDVFLSALQPYWPQHELVIMLIIRFRV